MRVWFQTRVFNFLLLPFFSIASLHLNALQIDDDLRGEKLAPEWHADTGANASVTPSANGLVLSAEPRMHALIQRANEIAGSDAHPLTVSTMLRTQNGVEGPMIPGMHLYWDNNNYASLRLSGDGSINCYWSIAGIAGERWVWNVAQEGTHGTKWNRQTHARMLLLSHNLAFYISNDGLTWRRIAETGRRPGATGKAPAIILGRGWAGERDGKPGLINDYFPQANRQIVSLVSDFHLSDAAGQPCAPPEIPKKDTWEQALAALDGEGIPKSWTFAGPLSLRNYPHKDLAPDVNDEWNALKAPDNQPIKTTVWNRPPEENSDGYVDLSEFAGHANEVFCWAKTEIQWPADGEALVWFDSSDPISFSVNGVVVYADREWKFNRRTDKDRRSFHVAMKKGRNVVKVRLHQNKGECGFYLRLEHNEPGYRIALLEKLLELFADSPSDWRAVQARLEIPRRYVQMENFPAALSAYDKAIAAFSMNEESRTQAFSEKLSLLDFLRDFDGYAKAAAGADSERATAAMVRGEVFSGHLSQARAHIERMLPQASPADAARMLRAVSSALAYMGEYQQSFDALDQLAGCPRAGDPERAEAASESAVCRWEQELRAAAMGKPGDPARLEKSCRSAANALVLLPGGKTAGAAMFAAEAEADLKNKRPERAAAGYVAALVLAWAANNPDAAQYTALNKAWKIALPREKDGKEIADPNRFRDLLSRSLPAQFSDAEWSGRWHFMNFEIDGAADVRKDLGPETKTDVPGHNWSEIDLPPGQEYNHDCGIDLARWAGNHPRQVAYLSREFDVKDSDALQLYVSSPGNWFAWIDGAPVGENTAAFDGFRLERDRVPLNLQKGKHRLLLKLESPRQGPFVFRTRVGHESEIAAQFLVEALTLRQLPGSVQDRGNWIESIRNFSWGKLPLQVMLATSETHVQLFAYNREHGTEHLFWTIDRLLEAGETSQALPMLQSAIRRLQSGNEYGARNAHLWELSRRLAFALVGEGRPGAADGVLRDAYGSVAQSPDDMAYCLTLRGCLRRDSGQSQAALQFFEQAVREGSGSAESQQQAVAGLDWARAYRPERLLYDTSHETQSLLDAIRRQLNAGSPDDVRHAVASVCEVLQSSAGSLIRIDESPFTTRHVGAREYVRAMLQAMPENARDIYRQAAAAAAREQLKGALYLNDPGALENIAGQFAYTGVARDARNLAGNLYLDRGQYAQAASVFQVLLREETADKDDARAAVWLAKSARACMFDGQWSSALASIERLKTSHGGKMLGIGGAGIAGSALAQRLGAQLEKLKSAGAQGAVEATYLDNLSRTGSAGGPAPKPGPVQWAHPLIPSASIEGAKGNFEFDPLAHVEAYPTVADNKVFIAQLESLRAIDISSGKVLWTRTWGSGDSPLHGSPQGFPTCCATVINSKVYVRALESRVSSIRCYSAGDGRLCWSCESSPELRKVVWISDPAIAYGMVFAAFLEPGDMNTHGIAALDALDGTLRWKTRLVTGNTGIKLNDRYFQNTLHLGPPAIIGGEVYAQTGLSGVVAVSAFSGQVKWLTSYPRLSLGDARSGVSGAGYDLRQRTAKTFSSGPQSPLLWDDSVIVAPKDGSGLWAFDRQTGAVRWQNELQDCRFIAGMADGNVLVCDDSIVAVNPASGLRVWECSLNGQTLFGRPTLSGGILYVPTESELLLVDAATGRISSSVKWDRRVGPLANLAITAERIIGIGESTVAALGGKDAQPARLPLYEARELENAGKLEAAAQIYGTLLGEKGDEALSALVARINLLTRIGKRDEALADIAKFEAAAPDLIASGNGLWQVSKDIFANALRLQAGEAPTVHATELGEPKGSVLSYAWQLGGENSHVYHASEGPQDRIFAQLGNEVCCMQLGQDARVLWRSFVGPGINRLAIGQAHIATVCDQRIVVLDRATGQPLSDIHLPIVQPTNKRKVAFDKFIQATAGEGIVAGLVGRGLYTWDARTGRILWSRMLSEWTPVRGSLEIAGQRIIHVFTQRGEAVIVSYDAKTGDVLQTLPLGKSGEEPAVTFSPDKRLLAYRVSANFGCVDVAQMKKMWENSAQKFRGRAIREAVFTFANNNLNIQSYLGNGSPLLQIFEVASGKALNDQSTGFTVMREGDSELSVTGEWNKDIGRQVFRNGHYEQLWKRPYADFHLLPLDSPRYAGLVHDRANIVFVRSQNRDQFVMRAVNWESGMLSGEQTLAGTPIRDEQNHCHSQFIQRGDTVLYTAREGIFALRYGGESAAQIMSGLRDNLGKGALNAEQTRNARRALYSFEPPAALAFVAPPDFAVNGDLSEWQGMEPVLLEGPANFVPLTDNAKWNGPKDLSAKLYTAWNRDGLAIAVDVTDDVFVAPAAGAELSSGDSIRVAIHCGGDRVEDFAASLALVNGRARLIQEAGSNDDANCVAAGSVVRAPEGTGCRYEMLIPWPLFRKDPNERPGRSLDLQLGVAIYDDDGNGVKGALEFGAGITVPASGSNTALTFVPNWLGKLRLFDVSHEKVERYRKVIDLAPGSDEAYRFLELLLIARQGSGAGAARAQEIENFLKAHPNCANTGRALALLRPLYRQLGEAQPEQRLARIVADCRIPEHISAGVLKKTFKFWVRPDEKDPPQMIMIQFNYRGDWNPAARAFWGVQHGVENWGQEGTNAMLCVGALPKRGEWTELTVYPSDLGVQDMEIKGLGITTFGGVTHFDRMSLTVDGKEKVLIDDSLPPGATTEYAGLNFVDSPKHDGAKSFTAVKQNASQALINTHVILPNGQPILSFMGTPPPPRPADDPAQYQAIWRKAAQTIPDTAEGIVFLKRVIELYPAEERDKKAAGELEAFLRANTNSPYDVEVLKMLYDVYARAQGDPLARCDMLMQECKLSRDVRRAFFSAYSPIWTEWHVLGAFPGSSEHRGLDQAMEPERVVDLTAKFGQTRMDITWTKVSSKSEKEKRPADFIDLRKTVTMPPKEQQPAAVFAYAYNKFLCPSKRRAVLLFGAQDVISIWLNGKRVVTELESQARKDNDTAEVQLRSGENEILIKVGVQRDQRLGFVFRLADLDGKPFTDISNE